MIQHTEAVTLLMALTALPILAHLAQEVILPARRLFYLAFTLVAAGYVFTVLEGLFWPRALNGLEHLSELGAAACFFLGCRALAAAGRPD